MPTTADTPRTPSPEVLPSLDAALAAWEHHGRPGVPDRGFTLSRLPGHRRRGIYRAGDDAPVFEPDGHILRMAPSPDGRFIAVQLADRADEDAALALVDTATGGVRTYPEVRCRYDPMLWSGDSARVELAAGGSHRWVRLDAATGRPRTTAVPPGVRLRLFPGGADGVLAESRPGRPTVLTDRATGAELGAFPAVTRVLAAGGHALVHDGTGLHAFDPRGGTRLWSWADPSVRITAVAARGDEVLVAGVRAGRSVLLRVVAGAVVADRPVAYQGEPAVATEVGADADRFHVLIEGPVLPPRVVTAGGLLADRAAATAPPAFARTEEHAFGADDGVDVPVVVTSPVGATGPAPLILTCYGGFGVPSLPAFEPTVPAWVEHGGRYAIAQIRGGGEHGAAWRAAGRGAAKERGIADLAAVARGLIRAGLTRPDLLVLAGASHGGVIAAACALASPGLCAGVVSTAAPLDLLNLGAHPLGERWIGEFGGPDDPERPERLRRISPLHRARELPAGTRPPRFLGIVLAEDSRVAADDTRAVVDALRQAGGDAALWRAPGTGHGGNHLDSLHRLGAAVLSFAAIATRSARTTPSTVGKGC
ncbi:prolyl oligopeptidase family serine peptidase [Streptomonospora sp. S1-112]|uniref:prolyl oligopeptidase n=1 Tax=Streptomonospora mangrovi TaxID=2883123 RepID=A0A9X3SER3_9ACTN|nr:prolyl oligopeptidase family serine peptidase [Streptomonospora mangrovi]MDA0565227.1 prolyl oligopeptidase family serine peptidase [Streptomonospora mangrovi]